VFSIAFLGLDIGTSGCKAGVFETDGTCLCLHQERYPVLQPAPGWMELDVTRVWQACEACLSRCARDAGSRVEAISVSSQGEAIFPIDRDGNPLYSAIVTFDGRAEEQAARLRAQFACDSQARFLRPVHSMFSAAKLLWLRERHIGDDAWKFMLFADYAVFQLCGETLLDHGLAGRTLLFDVRAQRWIPGMLEACGIRKSQLSGAVPSGTIAGVILPQVANRLGFPPTVRIVTGGHDQQCCAYGVGVLEDGVVMDTLGTTESILSVSSRAGYNEHLSRCCIPCDAYVRQGHYAYLGFLSTCGQAVEWLRGQVLAGQYDFETLSASSREPTGLLVLPHFAGSGTPWLSERDHGMIYGLTCATTREQLFKGILEGTAYEARVNVELMRGCGLAIEEIRVTGGGARSDLWLTAKADVYGMPLTILQARETGALGAAMLAARGVGDINESDSPWVHVAKVVQPDPANTARYAEQFERYRQLMKAMEGFKANEQL
jgi:xylulokinase